MERWIQTFFDYPIRVVHRLHFVGWERVPREVGPEGLIIASNHTAEADPVLLQTRVGATIRWMMDRTQMTRAAAWLWRQLQIIPVEFNRRDRSALQDGLAHLRSGGVLGVFPEGGIEEPPERLRPFQPGVGVLAARSGAPVLLVWMHGTPRVRGVLRSLFSRSRSVVHVVGLYRFTRDDGDGASASPERGATDPVVVRIEPRGIAEFLRQELAKVSGWPIEAEPLPHLLPAAANPERAASSQAERPSPGD